MAEPVDQLRAALADRYAIERELGSGGMATVYLAEDLKHHRKVAVKVLRPELAAVLGAERFLREIEIAARLQHPHILPLYDSGEADGFLYYVMPYVEGESLRDRLNREKQLPLDDAMRIARQVADALGSAHSHDVVHRDIKPENILLEEGHAVVADFGIARAITAAAGEKLTETGMAVGTPAYMSPEQAGGGEVDGRSDVYSLGCVLYEMLAGQPPFTGPTVESIVHQHLSVDPPAVSNLRPAVPSEIAGVLARALEKTPADRFTPAAQFAEALGRASTAGPISVETAPVVRPRSWRMVGVAVPAAILLAAGSWWAFKTLSTPGPGRIESLAVLPLDNLMGDPEQEYFVDGMTEALITDLAKIGSLTVISRTSAMQYKGVKKPLREIARELGVDAVIEGSVLRAGERVRISAQLIEAATDRHLWADSYERDLKDVLALQSEVARAIAREVQVTLTPQEELRLASARSVDPLAYEAYLRGRYHWNRRTKEAFEKAIEHFRQAIDLDPNYAPAYSGLADSYILLLEWGHLPPKEAIPLAKAAAVKALELDSTLAEAYTSLAEIRVMEWDWPGAESAFQRAVELNPGYPTAHQWYGFFLSKMGRHDKALAEVKRAQALDPLSLIINMEVGNVLLHAREYDRAIEEYRKTLELDPSFPAGPAGWAYEQKGMYEEAVAVFQDMSRGRPSADLAHAYALAGRRGEARKMLDEVLESSRREGSYGSPGYVALVYAALGQSDQAFAWLERAYAEGDGWLTYLKVHPRFDPLRDDRRFQQLLRRMNFPE